MRELREDTFLGNKNDDAHEHVERVLDIVCLFNIQGVSHDAIMLRIFPITLTGAAKRWIDRIPSGSINTWDLLKKAFIQRYCPSFKTTKQLEEIHNFKQEGDKTLYQAWERTSSGRSDEIDAITIKLDSLEQDIKKLKENVELRMSTMVSLEDLFQTMAETEQGDPNETMILGRPFLATIHARINVFHREILLVIGEDRILFDMNENVHQPTVSIEKVCMTNSIQEEESFNPLEIGRKGKIKMVEPGTVTWKLHTCKPIRVISEDLSRFLPTYDPNLKIEMEEIQSMKGISTMSSSNGIVIVIMRDGTSKVKI
ncbi:hypothetical protein Tco_0245565 [Tanacetum coccineum]